MSKLNKNINFETAFDNYTMTEQIGEGGAGRVYGGIDSVGKRVAVKVLTNESSDKKRRFKNETAFLSSNTHQNIVTVTDYGIFEKRPFYVMNRYTGSLRDLIRQGISPEKAISLFSQILDGVEAAHFQKVVHRDLKPENVLINDSGNKLAVADFGVASFTEERLHSDVKTHPNTRLANFQYAAPEQRTIGKKVNQTADIYALGLMLNELFTGDVPHGTEYQAIENIAPKFGFLDPIVAKMMRQNIEERPQSISDVKSLIQVYEAEAVSLQKIREIDNMVVHVGEVSDPLAYEPPKLVAAGHDKGILRLTLDRPVNSDWIEALNNMGSFGNAMGVPPSAFRFEGVNAIVSCQGGVAQSVIDHFKEWLPKVTSVLKYRLEQRIKREFADRRDRLAREREAENRRLEVNRSLKI